MLECYTPQPNPKRKRNRNRYRKNRGASSCYTLPPKACVEDFTNHLPIPLHHELNDYLDYSLLTSQLPDFSADEIDEDESLHKLPVLSASMLEDRTPSPSPVMSNVVNKICGRFCEPLDPMDFEELDEEIYGRFCERKMQPPIISKISDLPPEVQGPTYVSRSKADRISGLPEEIRGHILSFLPTKQAVATSLLNKRWTNLWKIDEDGASSSCYTLPPKACVEDFRNHLPIPLHHELNDYLDYSLLTSQLPDFSADEIDEDESLHKLPVLSASMLEDRTPSPSPVMSNVVNKICGRFCEPLDPMDFEELVASHVNADIALPSHSSRLVGIGIENIGNTCFMAAILQCLTHTGSHHTPCHVSGFCVICAFREHNNQALELSRDTIYPTRFLQNVNHFSAAFIPYAQGDEHEFMICALKKLKDALPKVEDNLIEQIFGGKTVSKVRCCSCGFSSDTTGPIFDLALAVENVSTVQSALESYITVENMDGMFKCSSCDQEVYMEKQLLIDKAPEIAVLQLKRFKSDGEKIQSQVDFPMNLDVAPYTSPKGREHDAILMYDLYAVVVHRGSTAKSGHYFSYVRSDEDKWHLMNDSNVFSVSEEDVLTQQAYLLFYAKHGPPWFSSVVKSEEKNLKPKSIDNTQDFGNGLLYGIDMEEEDVKIGGCR